MTILSIGLSNSKIVQLALRIVDMAKNNLHMPQRSSKKKKWKDYY
ncbi:MAG TPA: hypothetical protein VFJ51_10425 [Nitrososphaeraceae archaeon]|nr:hypothetical protein [Nitrososphaeraceae archaeon]